MIALSPMAIAAQALLLCCFYTLKLGAILISRSLTSATSKLSSNSDDFDNDCDEAIYADICTLRPTKG